MCGIAGVVRAGGGLVEADIASAERMSAALAHRGPDGCGLWHDRHAVLAHRRLAVIDPGPGGDQPMRLPGDGGGGGETRGVISYNGELYNDAAVRERLSREGEGVDGPVPGVAFASRCDTETVLHAVARWGSGAASSLRGMYALAYWDAPRRRLLLARDELGVKPLYLAELERGVAFASEVAALMEHHELAAEPDLAAVSAYLTTNRPELGGATMLRGVASLGPGEWSVFDAGGARPKRVSRRSTLVPDPAAAADLGAAVADSVRAQRRSDVPWCCLLSGGLDSTAIAAIAASGAAGAGPPLTTFCAGDPAAGSGDGDDFAFARLAAGAIGSEHVEVPVGRERFEAAWPEMVSASGVPMSTPNEVAIREVALAMRGRGRVVTLSGEGADELFGGYDLPLSAGLRFATANPGAAAEASGLFEVRTHAWVNAQTKARVLTADAWEAAGRDELLELWHAETFAAIERAAPKLNEPWDARRVHTHLRFQRAANLTNLLRRLDLATMAASVEGRVPFADRVVAGAAEAIPIGRKIEVGPGGEVVRTKLPLRRAFEGLVPGSILERPKRSFPLPFRSWLDGPVRVLRESRFAREIFRAEAVEEVCDRPGELWTLSWPMINVALWGRRWFG